MKKIVFTGFGKRAARIVKDYQEQGLSGKEIKVAGVYDTDHSCAQNYLDNLGIKVEIFSDATEMIEKTKPDGIMIASPEHAHLENFKQVHHANIPLFVEKPLESSIEKAAEFVKLAKTYKAPILSGHNMRFSPILNRAKQLIDQGTIGKINTFRFHNNVPYGHGYFRKWMRIRTNIGAGIVEKGCHDLDIIHMLTGSCSVKVFCKSNRFEFGGDKPNDLTCPNCPEEFTCKDSLRNIYLNVLGSSIPEELSELAKRTFCVYAREVDIEDDNICILTLENGCYGTYVQTFYSPYSYKKRIYTIVGSDGFMEIDMGEYRGGIKIFPRYRTRNDVIEESFDYLQRNHYNADYPMTKHFLDVVCGKAEPEISVADGYRAIATAFSADMSAREGREIEIEPLP